VLLAIFTANITVNLPLRVVLLFLLSEVRGNFYFSERGAFWELWKHLLASTGLTILVV
jgi:hypothetical protein